jgi:hypothetical protein
MNHMLIFYREMLISAIHLRHLSQMQMCNKVGQNQERKDERRRKKNQNYCEFFKAITQSIVHLLFIDFKKAYDSVRRKVLYNILNEFEIPRKLAGLIKMCLNETYITVCIDRNLIRFLFRMA